MKPQFALDLSHTGIRLLQLGKQEESELGAVKLDDPEFERHVYDLFQMADSQTKGRVRTQLIIPNSEVLYTRVETGDGDRDRRAKTVAEALQGMTPYDLEELVFDWRAEGEEALVAAVARETLEEAESFATRYGFNPVGFSARPVNGAFRGLPNFGQTTLVEARKNGAPWPEPPKPPAPRKPAAEAPKSDTKTAAVREDEGASATHTSESATATASSADTADAPAGKPKEAGPGKETQKATAQESGSGKETGKNAGPATPLGETKSDGQPADATSKKDPEDDDAAGQPESAPTTADTTFTLDDVPSPKVTSSQAGESAPSDAPPQAQGRNDTHNAQTEGEARRGETAGETAKGAPDTATDATAPDTLKSDSSKSDSSKSDSSKSVAPKGATNAPKEPAATVADAKAHKAEAAASDGAVEVDSKPEEPAAKGHDKGQKRGAGRTSAKVGPKAPLTPGPDKKTDRKTDKGAPPLPAFSSRRSTATPPPRPPGLPPAGSLPGDATPPPPRPRIPPHLAKAAPAVETPEGEKSGGRSSRLTALMARLQRVPDGGDPLESQGSETDAKDPTPLPEEAAKETGAQPDAKLGQGAPAEKRSPIKPAGDGASKKPVGPVGSDLSPPAKLASAPRVTAVAQDAPEQSAAAASLVPRLDRKPDSADPGPALPDRSGLNEAESLTLFGARNRQARERSMAPVLIGIAVVLVLATAVWASVLLLGRDQSGTAETGAITADPAESLAALPSDPKDGADAARPVPDDSAPAEPLSQSPSLTGPEGEIAQESDPDLGTPPDASTAATRPAATEQPLPDQTIETQETAQPLPDPESQDEALSRYAAMGIWQIPPDPPALPEGGRIDDLRVARLDSTLDLPAPSRLGPALDSAAVQPPPASLPPAPPGTEFDIGPDGRVVATPDGALTPQGVRVHSGSPSVTPPDRPVRPASLREAVPVNPEDLPELRPRERPEDAAEGSLVQDSALDPDSATDSDARPAATGDTETRQAATVEAAGPPGGAGTVDLAALTPQTIAFPPASPAPDARADEAEATDSEAAVAAEAPAESPAAAPFAAAPSDDRPEEFALRPAPRSETVARASSDIQTGAVQASTAGVLPVPSPPARPATLASLAQEAEAAEDGADAASDQTDEALPESPYAVIRSLKPASRPDGLEEQVARARAAQPAPAPAVEPAATVAPTGPTTASVAQAATETRVLNLSRVNLIGVYGSSSDRRALVRLPSGRFVKVQVGDRVDGGRVAAIGENQIQYVKSGRNITLQIPQG